MLITNVSTKSSKRIHFFYHMNNLHKPTLILSFTLHDFNIKNRSLDAFFTLKKRPLFQFMLFLNLKIGSVSRNVKISVDPYFYYTHKKLKAFK